MIIEYLPILIFILLGLIIGAAPMLAGWILGPTSTNKAKFEPYECGFPTFGDARMQFDVRYYLVAILFIIFDLETAFLVPWSIVLNKIGWFGFWSMMIFLGLLVLGFIYEWKKGALEWE